jgi:broad specificity phosphatase PhoE
VTVRRLLLARHGQTAYNDERRFTGWADPPLTSRGRAEARALGRRLRDLAIDAAYTSDLQRAVQTAQIALSAREGIRICADARLREACFGAWQGLTFAEASDRFPAEAAALVARSIAFCAPGGETIPQVRERVRALLTDLHQRHDGATVLLVSSGGPLEVLVADLFAMPVETHWRLRLANCALSTVSFAGGEPYLTLFNDRSHLARLTRR